jgi:predicted dehydrogenase
MNDLRVIVVGAGILGRRHARVFNEIDGVRVVGVADHSIERAAATGNPAFASLDDALAAVECEVVSVATPDHLHREPVLTALRAGKHVLVEKPLATSVADARAMIAAAQDKKRVLQVNYSQRWVPEYAWIKQQIAAGAIGRPVMVQSSKQDTIHVPTRMISWAADTSPIWFMSSHDIDLVTWFLDDTADSVVAMEQRGVLDGLGVAVHDGVDAIVRYTGGATASFHSSWIHPNSYPSITVDHITVVGESGVIEFRSKGREVECYTRTGGTVMTFNGPQTANEVDGRLEGAFRNSLLTFLAAVAGGPEAPTSAARTQHVVEIQEAILVAAARNEPVHIDPFFSRGAAEIAEVTGR